MAIHAKILIDDDRWARRPYAVSFDDDECNRRFKSGELYSEDECYERINLAKEAGFDIDPSVETEFF